MKQLYASTINEAMITIPCSPSARTSLHAAVGSTLIAMSAAIGGGPEGAAAGASYPIGADREALPPLTEDATISEYLTYAALSNSGLKAAFQRWQAAAETVPQARTLPNPQFGVAHFIREVETRVGPQKHRFSISQRMPWFGTLAARGNVASAAAQAAFDDYQAVRLQLFHDVKVAFHEYTYLHRAISITEENLQLLNHLEGVARARYKAGAPQSGVIQAQVELGKLGDQLFTLQDLRGPLSANLSAALHRPPTTVLPWPADPPMTEIRFNEQELLEHLAARNPELLALDHLVARQDYAMDVARKAAYPGVMVGLDYIVTDAARTPGIAGSGDDAVIAMIALDIPVWRSSNRAAMQEARRRRIAAKQTREERAYRLRADLSMAVFRFRDAERKQDLYRGTLIPQATQALQVAEETYRTGSTGFLDLIDAERLLLEFQLVRERASVDREIAIAEIEKLTGMGWTPPDDGTEEGRP
jgi:outer membrane protein TolC